MSYKSVFVQGSGFKGPECHQLHGYTCKGSSSDKVVLILCLQVGQAVEAAFGGVPHCVLSSDREGKF